MRVVDVMRRPSGDEVADIVAFAASVTEGLGARPLSDHLWLDLRAGGSDGFVAVTVRDGSEPIAYAQISAANDTSSLEAFADPAVPDAEAVVRDAVETALDVFAEFAGGGVFWWLDDPSDDDLTFASTLGFEPVRGLYEMRRPLPVGRRADIETRAFRPGHDDDAWLAVNNRAFAEHGEQGGWTPDTLRLRTAEAWFDPDGFRLYEVDGRLAGFCWTKLHHDTTPTIGEIYVIAVDPDFHGRGLGTQLTLAGLDSIADRGVTEANLYVDAENRAAIGLYERLGFTVHRHRRALLAQR